MLLAPTRLRLSKQRLLATTRAVVYTSSNTNHATLDHRGGHSPCSSSIFHAAIGSVAVTMPGEAPGRATLSTLPCLDLCPKGRQTLNCRSAVSQKKLQHTKVGKQLRASHFPLLFETQSRPYTACGYKMPLPVWVTLAFATPHFLTGYTPLLPLELRACQNASHLQS